MASFALRRGVAVITGAVLLGAAGAALAPPTIRADCEPEIHPTSTARTTAKLEAIAAALIAYHDAHGSLPPAYVAAPSGAPLLSWRVLILPFLGEADLYARFDLSRAWDDPVNYVLRTEMPAVFRGPGDSNTSVFTRYLGVVGARAAFEGASGVPFAAMTDGTADTPMIGQTLDEVVWTEPRDVDSDLVPAFAPGGFRSGLGPCVPFAHADGGVRFVSPSTPVATLAAYYDRADGNGATPTTCRTSGNGSLFQGRDIVVRGPVAVDGQLWASHRVRLRAGNGATLVGDVVGGDDVQVRAGNTITGDVLAGDQARVAGTVSGMIVSGAALEPDSVTLLSTGLVGTGPDVEVAAGASLALPPGVYGAVRLGAAANLTLGHDGVSGIYALGGLRLARGAVLTLDVSAGPIQIDAGRELVVGRDAVVTTVPDGEAGADDVCFLYLGRGSARIGPRATMLGSIFAGASKVLFKSGTRFKGRAYGETVVVGRDGRYVDLAGTLQ